MRRIQVGVLLLALPVLAASVVVVGCGKDTSKSQSKDKDKDKDKKESKKEELKALSARAGIVRGKVRLTGAPLDLEEMTARLVAEMDKKPSEKEFCGKGENYEHEQYSYRIGQNKQVGNVFVWIEPNKDEYFRVDDKQLLAIKEQAVVIDIPHCTYVPHCVLYVPETRDPENPEEHRPTGQKLVIKNSGLVSHHPTLGSWDEDLAPGKECKPEIKLQSSEYEIGCRNHPWMRCYLRTFDHPYAALSQAEPRVKRDDPTFGAYEIKNTPVGKMRIFAWHEKAGYLNKNGKEGEAITVKDEGITEVNFELEVK